MIVFPFFSSNVYVNLQILLILLFSFNYYFPSCCNQIFLTLNFLDSTEKGDGDSGGDGRKSKRARTKTQPFQSSDMDLNLLRAIKATAAAAASQQVNLNVKFSFCYYINSITY